MAKATHLRTPPKFWLMLLALTFGVSHHSDAQVFVSSPHLIPHFPQST